jgi:hypothetical protein
VVSEMSSLPPTSLGGEESSAKKMFLSFGLGEESLVENAL